MESFYDCTGPSLQLFYTENEKEKSVIVFGSEIPPERNDVSSETMFTGGKVLSGKWTVAGKKYSEGHKFDDSASFTVQNAVPIIENMFCYYPGYLQEFVGSVNKTKTGEYCSSWECDEPGNYCSNKEKRCGVDGLDEPWCIDNEKKVVGCGVPTCGWDSICKTNKEGRSFRGEISHTSRGYTCRNWHDSWPHPNSAYNNEEAFGVGNHNYCRNPDPGYNTLFCYTTNWFKRFDDCDNILLCSNEDHHRYLFSI